MVYTENSLSYEDYCRLRESVGWMNFSREQAEQALRCSSYIVTAEDEKNGGHVAAMGRLTGDGLYYLIVDVVVEPQYQGKGVGGSIIKLILEYVEKNLQAGGRVSVQLTAAQGKEGFYENMGFKKIPHEHCGSGMRKVLYKD